MRAETVATKLTFLQAFRTKRCLIVADSFYEWKRASKRRVPYRILLKSGEPFAFAGIWSLGHDPLGQPYTTFAIITTEANAVVAEVHNRMPVILHARDEADWLNPRVSLDAAQALLVPFPADLLTVYEVSPKVNAVAYNAPDLLQPIVHAERLSGEE